MEDIVATLKTFQLHPVANHFTFALLTIALLTDLVASLFSSRVWLRYMALTLTVLGAGFVALSWVTGDWEGDRLEDLLKTLQGPTKDLLHSHAEWGEWLMYIFAVLAIWRLLVQSVEFFAGTRPLYLLAAIVAIVLLFMQGWRGGKLVFEYGVGTQLLAATPSPSATPTPAPLASPGGIPTVFVPPASTPAPSASPTHAPSAAATL